MVLPEIFRVREKVHALNVLSLRVRDVVERIQMLSHIDSWSLPVTVSIAELNRLIINPLSWPSVFVRNEYILSYVMIDAARPILH